MGLAASFYIYVYLLIVSIITLSELKVKQLPKKRKQTLFAMLLSVFMVLFIGFRPISYVFVDMMNYNVFWHYAMKTWIGFNWNADNLLFDNLLSYMAAVLHWDIRTFFVLIAVIYFGGIYVACKKLFPDHVLLALLVYLAAFSTFSYATNGIKSGAAASLFLVALAYRDKIVISIVFLLLSWGFHHSMQMPIAAYILTLLFKSHKWYFYGWCFCLLMAVAHVSFFQNLFAGFTDETGADYLSSDGSDWGGKTGFRLDFVIYSVMPIIMGYYVKYKYRLKDKLYDVMLNIYLTCNGVWMLCMYANFTNRIAYLSWFIYPILLIYPCLSIADMRHPLVCNRNKIVLAHLGFTLFMSLIYYA